MSLSLKLKKKVCSSFKMNGFDLRKDAIELVCDVLLVLEPNERPLYLDKILNIIQNQELKCSMIGCKEVQLAIDECKKEGEQAKGALQVFDAFTLPKFSYKSEFKKFLKRENSKSNRKLGGADDKTQYYLDRYWLLHQRTSRHKLFTPPATGIRKAETRKYQLRNVEFLLGCTSKLKEIIVLGMIAKIHEGKFHLEDPTGIVEMDLKEAKFQTGIITESSFVLAEGWYDDDIFHVTALGFPPLEPAQVTKSYYGNVNFFTPGPLPCPKAHTKLKNAEGSEAGLIVFLSDVFLDHEKTLEHLEEMLKGFDNYPPACFVFCGRFCSAYGSSHLPKLKQGLSDLSNIITKFPNITEESHFVFVPSSQDYGIKKMLPRPPVPSYITKQFCDKIPKAIFTTNPCRIQYFTQEIIVFRDDLMRKMCKNSLKCPSKDLPENLSKTILSQSYLSPLPLHLNPVWWQHSQALHIYPMPDLVVLCDQSAPAYKSKHVDTTCINPGSFSCGDYNFKVYDASTKEIEDSRVPI